MKGDLYRLEYALRATANKLKWTPHDNVSYVLREVADSLSSIESFTEAQVASQVVKLRNDW